MARFADRDWSDTEISELKENYPTTDTRELAKRFQRTPNAVYRKASQLRLSKIHFDTRADRRSYQRCPVHGYRVKMPCPQCQHEQSMRIRRVVESVLGCRRERQYA